MIINRTLNVGNLVSLGLRSNILGLFSSMYRPRGTPLRVCYIHVILIPLPESYNNGDEILAKSMYVTGLTCTLRRILTVATGKVLFRNFNIYGQAVW